MGLENVKANIAEVILIGTGGYGESILIHLGNNEWVIVDSCIDPQTKIPLSIEYLRKLGVHPETDVKLILCTHWHDDHILGISKVLEVCQIAKFAFSKAHDRAKFLKFISYDYEKAGVEASNASTLEFNRCIDIMEARRSVIVSAIENKPLITVRYSDLINNQVIALSPSDFTMEKFDHEISGLITEYGSPSKRIPEDSPNAKSVAVMVKIGNHRVILGADLEVSADTREGWVNILNCSQVIDKKSSLFKIPHHGSKNAYHVEIWNKLLEKKPVAELTPWNRGNGLPEAEMLITYCGHSDQLFMTSPHTNRKPKQRDRQIGKFIKKMHKKLEEVKYKKGIVRCRIDITNQDATWKINLEENAIHVNGVDKS